MYHGDLLLLAGVLHEVVIVRHDCGVRGEVGTEIAVVFLSLEWEVGRLLLIQWIEVIAIWCCLKVSRLVCLREAAVGACGRAPLSRGSAPHRRAASIHGHDRDIHSGFFERDVQGIPSSEFRISPMEIV